MAILTLAQTLQAARIVASTDNIPATITATATPLYEGAVDAINRYASGAPDNTKNLALERLFGYLWEEDRVGGRRSRYPLVDSGAASILTPYRSRRAASLDPAPARATANGTGIRGATGPPGPRGPVGPTGPAGPQGPAGAAGQDGTDGATGATGPKGDKGDTGARGLQGPAGPAGQDGTDGAQGATGPKGDTGAQGPQGLTGPAGQDGTDGATGATGPKGDTGDTGAQGPQGLTGPQGPPGPAGQDGTDGAAGAAGATGPKGDKGDTGAAGQGVPTGGTDGQVLTKSSARDYDTAWEDAATATGGLTQSQVDGRINTLIPANRRVPTYAVGDANEVLTVAADGNSLHFATAPTGPAGAKGDKGDKGDTGATGPKGDPATNDRLLSEAATPATAGYSAGDIINVQGELYELVASTDEANIYRGTIAANAAGDSGYFGDMTFRWQTASPYNMRASFDKTALTASPPDHLWIKFHSGNEYADIKLDRASGRDTAGMYGYVHSPGTPGIEANTIGAAFDLTVYSNDAYTTAQAIHSANRWELDKRDRADVNPIALGGNTDRWPKAKLPEDTVYGVNNSIHLLERTPGLTLPISTTQDFNVGQAPYYWSNPGVDLDTYPNGEFHCSLELTILPTSDVNMGFVQGKANQLGSDRQVALSNIIFASDLAEVSDYVTGRNISTLNGLNVFRQTVYSGATIVGHYTIIMVHNANNEVGYHVFWDGEAGATTATFNAELRITFTPSDTVNLPAKNTRGALQATTATLPTTVSNNQTIATTWTIASGSSLAINSDNTARLNEPYLRTVNTQTGYWIVAEIGGSEAAEMFYAFNQGARQLFKLNHNTGIYWQPLSPTPGDNTYELRGRTSSIPANTVIKIYLAVI